MLVRTLVEHTVNGKAKAEGEEYDLTDAAVADAVERGLVEPLTKAEVKQYAAAAIEAGVAGDASDVQAAAVAGLELEQSGEATSGTKRGKRK